MTIVSLEAQSILRLTAIKIVANGHNVTLTGENASGKTSVLNCIEMALGGKDAIPGEPIHQGHARAHIVLDLGDIKVKRTFTKGGDSSLVVTSANGSPVKSPQGVLDELVGRLTFDPLEFTRMKPDLQRKTLMNLVGLNFETLDARRKELYDERRNVNREYEAAVARMTGMPSHMAITDQEETSAQTIIAAIEKANSHNAKKADYERLAKITSDSLSTAQHQADQLESEIEELQRQIEAKTALREQALGQASALEGEAATARAIVDNFVMEDTQALSDQLRGLEDTNRKIRENRARKAQGDIVLAQKEEADDLTMAIGEIDEKKRTDLEKAKYPVDGLAFTEDAVLYKGLPFNQASAAEQLRISAAIGMALNPKLKILMIRDASLIDDNGMKALAEAAQKEGFQLWCERVSNDKEVQVIIEDGEAK